MNGTETAVEIEKVMPGMVLEELHFIQHVGWAEAFLYNPDGTEGVRITYQYHPTCHRRGQHKLLIEVMGTPYHHSWGCFDDQDQPARWYYDKETALEQATKLAQVLLDGFHDRKTPGT